MVAALLAIWFSMTILAASTTIPIWAQYLGLGFAAVAAAGTVVAGLYWACRCVKGRLIWRDPIDSISYLLPKGQYPLRRFPGGPEAESLRAELRVGLGEYLVPVEFWVKAEMIIDEVVWAFSNNAHTAVTDLGEVSPFMLDREQLPDGRIRYRDWWGEWRTKSAESIYQPNITWLLFHRIAVSQPYNGNLEITFRIRGHDLVRKTLPFTASDHGPDDIPYLRDYVWES